MINEQLVSGRNEQYGETKSPHEEAQVYKLLLKQYAPADLAVWRALAGPIGSDAPTSFLRYHPHVTFVLDKQAARLL